MALTCKTPSCTEPPTWHIPSLGIIVCSKCTSERFWRYQADPLPDYKLAERALGFAKYLTNKLKTD